MLQITIFFGTFLENSKFQVINNCNVVKSFHQVLHVTFLKTLSFWSVHLPIISNF